MLTNESPNINKSGKIRQSIMNALTPLTTISTRSKRTLGVRLSKHRSPPPTPVHLPIKSSSHKEHSTQEPEASTKETPNETPEEAVTTEGTIAEPVVSEESHSTQAPAESEVPEESLESAGEITTTAITVQPVEVQETESTPSFITSSSIPESTTRKMRRTRKTKMQIAKEYIYGRKEYEDFSREDIVSFTMPEYRINKTYYMRRSFNNKRIDCSRVAEINDNMDDISSVKLKRGVGKIPSHLFLNPAIPVRHTVGSKFRYLFNRRPPGVKVYFKSSKADPRARPPFVAATSCYWMRTAK